MDSRFETYTPDYFNGLEPSSLSTARVVVPLLVDLFDPTSVVDVGCGLGSWLHTFAEHGVADLQGVDGPWLPQDQLQIPRHLVHVVDLEQRFHLERTFELALCLEVAEHLSHESAPNLVESLTELAPSIVFSAAIPFQGGDHHLNEQWPDYWIELFERRGYEGVDALRAHVWDDPRVAWWYSQNLIIFVRSSGRTSSGTRPRALVHPKCYLNHITPTAAW